MGMGKVIPLHSDDGLRRKIAAIAEESSRIVITAHAKKRMCQRRVLLTQVVEVLKLGRVVEPAHQAPNGDWRCTLEKLTAGDVVRVAAAVHESESGELVIVVTVMN